MTKEAIQKETLKMLSKQGSDQLLNKLKAGVLMGISKDTALEILQKRKVEIPKELLSKGETWVKPKSITSKKGVKIEVKGISSVKETFKVKAPKQEKESIIKEKKKINEDLKFKKGDKIKFKPGKNEEEKEIMGEVISSYIYTPKTGESREDLRIKANNKVYIKMSSRVTLIK